METWKKLKSVTVKELALQLRDMMDKEQLCCEMCPMFDTDNDVCVLNKVI